MNWQEFLPLLIVLGVGAIFVWRSSSSKKHEHSADCGCKHKDPADAGVDSQSE